MVAMFIFRGGCRDGCRDGRAAVNRGAVRRMHAFTQRVLLVPALIACAAHGESPFATEVISYNAGVGAVAGFTTPMVALGQPERFTGEGLFPACVTPFAPSYRPNEIVSLGVGGMLILAFDHPVLDDPRNPHGIDLLVFGNSFFTELKPGAGVGGALASEGGRISISADGVAWTVVRNVVADGMFPTMGYIDSGPYSSVAGSVTTDFLRPVNPTLTMNDLSGLDYESLVTLYEGSGGGAGVDIGAHGLTIVRYVRIEGAMSAGYSPEIDAIADVAPISNGGDLDSDGFVAAADLAMLLAAWNSDDVAADLDGNGVVGAADLAQLLAAWTSSGTP